MNRPKVLGIDLSLTGTGLAGEHWADTIAPPKPPARNAAWRRLTDDERRWATVEYRHQRLAAVTGVIRDRYITSAPDLVVLEGLAYDAYDTDRQLAGLSWKVRQSLWRLGIPYAIVPPSNLKQFATGNGAASKAAVLAAAAARFPWFKGDDNAADALILVAMGHAALQRPLRAPLGAVELSAVSNCQWPDLEPLRARYAVPPTSPDTYATTGVI